MSHSLTLTVFVKVGRHTRAVIYRRLLFHGMNFSDLNRVIPKLLKGGPEVIMSKPFKPWIVYHIDAEGKKCSKDAPDARRMTRRGKNYVGRVKDAAGNFRTITLCADLAASKT